MNKISLFITAILMCICTSLQADEPYDSLADQFTKQTSFNISSKIKENNPVAKRMDAYLKWLIEEKKDSDQSEIIKELKERYNYFITDKETVIDASTAGSIGANDAPVEIIFYLSTSCQECLEEAVSLHESVTNGKLKGKAKLYALPFRNKFGEKALLAAKKNGKFWQYLKELSLNQSRLDIKRLLNIGEKTGIDKNEFKKELIDKSLSTILKKVKKEASANNVRLSSTTFINKKRYQGSTEPEWIIDAVLYEYEKTKQ